MSAAAIRSKQVMARLVGARLAVGGGPRPHRRARHGLHAAGDANPLPAAAGVVVAELFAEVVAWNREPLRQSGAAGRLERCPRQDRCGDIAGLLEAGGFRCMLLDIDDGPGASCWRATAHSMQPKGCGGWARRCVRRGCWGGGSQPSAPSTGRGRGRPGLGTRSPCPLRGVAAIRSTVIYLAGLGPNRNSIAGCSSQRFQFLHQTAAASPAIDHAVVEGTRQVHYFPRGDMSQRR